MKSLLNIIKFILSHPLASKNKWEAMRRFFGFQIGRLLNPYPIIYPFTEKTGLIIEKGMAGATGNLYCGLHEFEDMGFLLHFLRPEDLFVDVGANIGSYTILASGQIGSSTISFEPIPATFKRMQKNIAVNFLKEKVTAYNMGVGSKKQTLQFTTGLDTVNHVVLEKTKTNVLEVPVDTLDNMLEGKYPILVKIDVEGFESEVLAGATGLITDPTLKAIIIELNGSGTKYGFSEEDIHNQLVQNNFLPYQYDPFTRNLTRTDVFGTGNSIYIRNIDFVHDRIQSSEKITIMKISF